VSRAVTVFVCGIFTEPGDQDNWTARALAWTNINRDVRADSYEYLTDALFRNAGEGVRAKRMARKLGFYYDAGFDVSLVAHSNGNDVCLDALKILGYPPIRQFHMIAPAVHEDCDASGLNRVMADSVHIYIGGKDLAMRAADTVLGHAFGFDDLGRRGPQNVKTTVPICIVRQEEWGHSTWFLPENFEYTMQLCVPI
jgi:hypothetical protein